MIHEHGFFATLLNRPRGLRRPDEAPGDSSRPAYEVRTAELERENAALREQLAAQAEASARREAELQARIAALEERLNTSSRNSSQPARQDRPDQKPPRTRDGRLSDPGKRRRGGQRGHKGHARVQVPEDMLAGTTDVSPKPVCDCGGQVEQRGEPYCMEQAELPQLKVTFWRYRLFTGVCLTCGRVHRAELPDGVVPGLFGAHLLAFIGILVGGYQLGRRGVQTLLSALLGLSVSPGTLSRAEERLSQALAPVYEEAREAIEQAPALNLDETGGRREGKRSWIWMAANATMAVFLVSSSRGAVALSALIGNAFKGLMSTDRWHTYNRHATHLRQLCWAHLLRDFQKIADRGGASRAVGQALVKNAVEMFKVWGRFKDGEVERAQMKTELLPIQSSIDALLAQGSALEKETTTAETCKNLVKLRTALWTFVEHEALEPTNNRAERLIRNAVVWRNRSQGIWSERGDRYVERILTTVVSLRLQKRDPLQWLTQALHSHHGSGPRPSLLPD